MSQISPQSLEKTSIEQTNMDRSKKYHQFFSLTLIFCSIGISLFQLCLALGIPLGKAAWGGSSSTLSPSLRIASTVAFFLWAFVSHVLCIRAGLLESNLYSERFIKNVLNFVFYLMVVSCVLNWISRSPLERNIWGPITSWIVFSFWYIRRCEEEGEEEESQRSLYQTIST